MVRRPIGLILDTLELDRAVAGAQRVRRQIHDVLAKENLIAVFQPIVGLACGEVVGVEALTRFLADPPAGPDVWFAMADSVGLGVKLELLAVRRALASAAGLPGHLDVSVNASPSTCLDTGFAALIRNSPVASSRIIVELTEHRPVPDYALLRSALEPLRAEGVRIAVDDAGAGFASFQRILQLRPEFIKLDREIIAGLNSDSGRRALGLAVVDFAAAIGARVIAEGIETAPELHASIQLGMFAGQGFLLGRPTVSPEQWAQWQKGSVVLPVRVTAAQRLFDRWQAGRGGVDGTPLPGPRPWPVGPADRSAGTTTTALRGGRFAAAVLDALPDATAVLDFEGNIVAVNRAWTTFGRDNGGGSESSGVGINYLEVCDRAGASGSEDAIEVATGLRAILAGRVVESEREYSCDSDEVRRWFISRIAAIDPPNGGAVASHVNITRQRLRTLAPVEQRSADYLTGLPDRATFMAGLAAALDHRRPLAPGRHIGLLYIALEDFHRFDDSYGHVVSDEFLRVAAFRVGAAITDGVLCRIENDEFAAYMTDVDRQELAEHAETVAAELARPYTIHGRRTQIRGRIGQYLLDPSLPAAEALFEAHRAMNGIEEGCR